MLLEIASRTLRQRWSVERVREHLEGGAGFDEDLERTFCELGWSSLAVPTELGGAGQSPAALVPLVEPMGRHLVAGPFVGTQIATQGLLAAPLTAARNAWIERIVQGGHMTLALHEEDGSWDFSSPATRCETRGGRLVLSGSKVFVEHYEAADGVLVSAVDSAGALVLMVLDRSRLQGAAHDPEKLVDLTRRSSALRFDDLQVEEDTVLLWRGEDAQRVLAALRETAWLLSAAEACGGVQGVLEVLLDYLKQRRQFGRTIGSYQALKHPTVEILIGLERSRSLLYHAATLVGRSSSSASEREVALRMAKAEVGAVFLFASDRAIQFHGGVGFTWECDAQLFLRRAQWSQAQWGDPLHHRRRLAELLC